MHGRVDQDAAAVGRAGVYRSGAFAVLAQDDVEAVDLAALGGARAEPFLEHGDRCAERRAAWAVALRSFGHMAHVERGDVAAGIVVVERAGRLDQLLSVDVLRLVRTREKLAVGERVRLGEVDGRLGVGAAGLRRELRRRHLAVGPEPGVTAPAGLCWQWLSLASRAAWRPLIAEIACLCPAWDLSSSAAWRPVTSSISIGPPAPPPPSFLRTSSESDARSTMPPASLPSDRRIWFNPAMISSVVSCSACSSMSTRWPGRGLAGLDACHPVKE